MRFQLIASIYVRVPWIGLAFKTRGLSAIHICNRHGQDRTCYLRISSRAPISTDTPRRTTTWHYYSITGQSSSKQWCRSVVQHLIVKPTTLTWCSIERKIITWMLIVHSHLSQFCGHGQNDFSLRSNDADTVPTRTLTPTPWHQDFCETSFSTLWHQNYVSTVVPLLHIFVLPLSANLTGRPASQRLENSIPCYLSVGFHLAIFKFQEIPVTPIKKEAEWST